MRALRRPPPYPCLSPDTQPGALLPHRLCAWALLHCRDFLAGLRLGLLLTQAAPPKLGR